MDKYNKRKTGALYEHQAAVYLEANGYRIKERNFQFRSGEIDLIAVDHGVLVFIEVKYRRTARNGHPSEAVHARKQRQICRTALFYLIRYGIGTGIPCRFDVVCILGEEVQLIRDAFPFHL